MGMQVHFDWKDLLPHNEVIVSACQLGFSDEDEHIPYIAYSIEVIPGCIARLENRVSEYRVAHNGDPAPVTVQEKATVERNELWAAQGLFFSLGESVTDIATADCGNPQAIYLLQFLIENRVNFTVS